MAIDNVINDVMIKEIYLVYISSEARHNFSCEQK